jgi:hypothetical protein
MWHQNIPASHIPGCDGPAMGSLGTFAPPSRTRRGGRPREVNRREVVSSAPQPPRALSACYVAFWR